MKKDELLAIKQAIINEIEGYEFYKMAEKQADSNEAKESFNSLASEELKHSEYLKELFKKLQDNDDDAFTLAFLSNPPSPHIYDWQKYKFPKSTLTVAIYGTAVSLEQASIDFYKKAKENTENAEAKKLFQMLENWENVHLEQFSKAYEINMESWWDDQGFAPF